MGSYCVVTLDRQNRIAHAKVRIDNVMYSFESHDNGEGAREVLLYSGGKRILTERAARTATRDKDLIEAHERLRKMYR